MSEIKIVITIKGHLNEPIKGLSYTGFEIEGHRVIMCTEEPAGKYILYCHKNIHPIKKLISKVIKCMKSLFN